MDNKGVECQLPGLEHTPCWDRVFPLPSDAEFGKIVGLKEEMTVENVMEILTSFWQEDFGHGPPWTYRNNFPLSLLHRSALSFIYRLYHSDVVPLYTVSALKVAEDEWQSDKWYNNHRRACFLPVVKCCKLCELQDGDGSTGGMRAYTDDPAMQLLAKLEPDLSAVVLEFVHFDAELGHHQGGNIKLCWGALTLTKVDSVVLERDLDKLRGVQASLEGELDKLRREQATIEGGMSKIMSKKATLEAKLGI